MGCLGSITGLILDDGVKLLDHSTVWMRFAYENDAEEFLLSLKNEDGTPFWAVDRWMEVLGRPPGVVWLRFKGVTLHVWREGLFKLLGDCLGQTSEVDHRPIQ